MALKQNVQNNRNQSTYKVSNKSDRISTLNSIKSNDILNHLKNTSDDCIRISLNDSLKITAGNRRLSHAVHCLLYAGSRSNESSMYALMQLRSDGLIGFAGGSVDILQPNENDIIDALMREIEEEINYRTKITRNNYLMTHVHLKSNTSGGKILITHFFIKKLPSIRELEEIERTHMCAQFFPKETLGIMRIPIFPENIYYFENFSKQNFAGNAYTQLREAIHIIRECPDDEWI